MTTIKDVSRLTSVVYSCVEAEIHRRLHPLLYADPEAASIVFNAGLPLVMVGLDVTSQATLKTEIVEKIKGMNKTGFVRGIHRSCFIGSFKIQSSPFGSKRELTQDHLQRKVIFVHTKKTIVHPRDNCSSSNVTIL
ncbi:nucleoside hydrolase [Paenibacillus popilliae]|uniref:nucleoside hydrolase n=1 Tax=Paenibacillus popilliae TaxID=78057 RepID=UPI0005A8B990|nr:nucleoside hydrolase [Paenibacillus popilliae]